MTSQYNVMNDVTYRGHLRGIRNPTCAIGQLENELYHCEDVQYETFDVLHMVCGR